MFSMDCSQTCANWYRRQYSSFERITATGALFLTTSRGFPFIAFANSWDAFPLLKSVIGVIVSIICDISKTHTCLLYNHIIVMLIYQYKNHIIIMLISIIIPNDVLPLMVRISRGMHPCYATGFFISPHKESTSDLRLQKGSAFSVQEYTSFFVAVIFLYFFFDFILLQFRWRKMCYAVERSVCIRGLEGSHLKNNI